MSLHRKEQTKQSLLNIVHKLCKHLGDLRGLGH
jgi:hypothetical protein